MNDTAMVDARGLSCPQPVLMTLDALRARSGGALTVLVDAEVSKENVMRAAGSRGWSVEGVEEEDGGVFRIRVAKR
ncbi:MAG: preprotein translocase subunit TatB [Lentisphaerae bacterium]|nr:preprotein translocase subunit TatB [Lentisphaerota bacterium]